MGNSIVNQIYLLLVFTITGIAIGILFDVFRILRKTFKTSNFITYIEDIVFWILTGTLFLNILFKFNNGEIRNYVILGVIIGVLLYMLNISRYFISINLKIIDVIKRVLIIPIRPILRIFSIIFKLSKSVLIKMFKPLTFIVINIRKSSYNFVKKIGKLPKKC